VRSLLLSCSVLIGYCVLGGCGASPPTRFYTLNEVSPASPPAALNAIKVVPVRLEPVAIPAELDRLELVSHAGSNQVRVSESDRWVAPLDEQIRRILSEDLVARLPAGMVADPNEPSTDEPRRRLSIEIAQFEADQSCAISLRASWTLRAFHTPNRSGSERVEIGANPPCPGSLPAAMSRALGILADRLAPLLVSP
jgi:uncharacterized lipoprotein YmbA